MAESNRVVVKFIDGKILKGHSNDFLKSRPYFHLRPVGDTELIRIPVAHLKAVFFVKTFEGRKTQHRKLKHVPAKETFGRKVKVLFRDGESIEGRVQIYDPAESVFLLVPDDPTGNNVRIFCNREAVDQIVWISSDGQTVEKIEKRKIGFDTSP